MGNQVKDYIRVNIIYKSVNSKNREYYTTETLYFNKECVNFNNFIESKAKNLKVKAEEIEKIDVYNNDGEILEVIQDKNEIEKMLRDTATYMAPLDEKIGAYQPALQVKFVDGTTEYIEIY